MLYHLTAPRLTARSLARRLLFRFSGASDEAISRAIDNALGLPRGTPAVIRDPEDGSALAISNSIPDGLTLDAKAAVVSKAELGGMAGKGGASHWKGDNGSQSGGPADGRRSDDGFHGDADSGKAPGAATEFRGELLKFERVNAHLANERTWLAWVRTALSVLGVALSLLSLSDDLGSVALDSLSLSLGIAFVLCTLLTYFTGWLRYTRVKEVLTWTGSQVKETFGRFGLQYFTRFLGIALILAVPLYIVGGINVVVDA